MSIVKNILSGLDRRKIKMFAIFLACSFLAWLISNLSEPYESRVAWDLNLTNLPDTLLVDKGSKGKLETKVSAGGFRFLSYSLGSKSIDLDLSNLKVSQSRFYYPKPALRKTMEQQLGSNIRLLEIDIDTLFVSVYPVSSKKVSVKPVLTLGLEQNYLLNGQLVVEPDTILLKGPMDEVASIEQIETAKAEVLNLNSDFSISVALAFPQNTSNTVASTNSVKISGKVVRFSEKVFQTDIKVQNGPEGYSVKTFPKSVSVLCKAAIEDLKSFKAEDFMVITNYQNHVGDKLFLDVEQYPEKAYDVRLLENQVDFILEKQ